MRYWVYMNGEVPGSFTPAELSALPGFLMTTLVCPAEGEILEKNWRRAGEFSDIAPLVTAQEMRAPPAKPAPVAPAPSLDVDAMIDTASNRLFSHVADLMKELENRREEKALGLSLQRQIVDLKGQLQESREKTAMAESRLPRISELEEARRKDEARLQAVETELKTHESAMGDLRVQMEKAKMELDTTRRRLSETANDLTIRNRLVDKLSHDLTDKELSLAKSLAVIRRLEEDLNRICPAPSFNEPPEEARHDGLPPVAEAAPAPIASQPDTRPSGTVIPFERAAFTTDEPPPTPPFLEPNPQSPAAQHALVDFFKKFMTKDQH